MDSKLLPLAPIALCTFLSACIVDRQAEYFYPTDLETARSQLFLWPADSSGDCFRCAVQDSAEDLRSTSADARTLDWDSSAEELSRLSPSIDGATLLVPIGASVELRDRGSSLIAAIARAFPDASTHVILVDRDLWVVGSPRDLAAELQWQQRAHFESRPMGIGQGFGHLIGMICLLANAPNYVIVPVAAGPDRFAVLGDWRDSNLEVEALGMPLADAISYLSEKLADPAIRSGMATWGTVDNGQVSMSVTTTGSAFLAVILPKNLPVERREQCRSLIEQLLTEPNAPLAIAEANAIWEWSECQDEEAIRRRMPPKHEWSYVEGAVRQTAILRSHSAGGISYPADDSATPRSP